MILRIINSSEALEYCNDTKENPVRVDEVDQEILRTGNQFYNNVD